MKSFEFIIRNARVISGKGRRTRLVDIGVADGKIGFVAKSNGNNKIRTSHAEIDLSGRIVFPGLIDSHIHLFAVAENASFVDLYGSRSVNEMLQRIREYIKIHEDLGEKENRKSWVLGRGWEQDKLAERRFPTRFDLDKVVTSRPAMMVRVCGHVAVLNTVALDLLLSRLDSKSLDKILIEEDKSGQRTGIIRERALEEAWKLVPDPSISKLVDQFLYSQKLCLENGIVGVTCILSENWKKELKAIRRVSESGRLRIRVCLLLPISALEEVESGILDSDEFAISENDGYAVHGFKLFADGSLGARTAALNEDYSDDPGNSGILNYADSEIIDYARRIKKLRRYILATHAIGDRALDQALRCYAKAGVTKKDKFRIEHCSVLDHKSKSKLSLVVSSVQPGFEISDYWIAQRLGRARSKRAYPFRTIFENSTMISGSDAPADSINPLRSFYAATHNKIPSQRLSLNEILRSYTETPSKCCSLLRSVGSIARGKDCDITVSNETHLPKIFKSNIFETFVRGIPTLTALRDKR